MAYGGAVHSPVSSRVNSATCHLLTVLHPHGYFCHTQDSPNNKDILLLHELSLLTDFVYVIDHI